MDSFFVKPFPVRPVPSGTISLGAGLADSYSGVSARQARRTFIITNISTTLALKICSDNSVNMLTIFPQTNIALDTDADMKVYNPNGSSVDYEVVEFFFDEGTARQSESLPAQRARESGGNPTGGDTSGGGSTAPSYSGGGVGDTSTRHHIRR